MRLFQGITPATRLGMALAFVATSLLFVATSIGLVPDRSQALADGRLRLSEGLALQLSVTADQADPEALRQLAESMLLANGRLRSVGLRNVDGVLTFTTDNHKTYWNEIRGDPRELTHVEMPIYRAEETLGTVEVCFLPLVDSAFVSPATRLALFIGLGGFILFSLYLKRVLRYLDPSAVIPERVKAMLDTMVEGVLVLDTKRRIVLANAAFEHVSGFTLSSLQGRQVTDIAWLSGSSDEPLPWDAVVSGGRALKGVELRREGPDEDSQVFMVNTTPIVGGDGTFRGALATFDNVTAIEEKNTRLERMVRELDKVRKRVQKQNDELTVLATRDTLTNCFNRRALFERLEMEYAAAESQGTELACVMLDIDHFKSVNDRFGHAGGDTVLREGADALRSRCREADILARYGGEEFCLLLPGTSIEEAVTLAEKLRMTIAFADFGGIHVTASFGVSSLAVGTSDSHDLIDRADQALYSAKNTGRNKVVRCDRMATSASPAPQETEPTSAPESHNAPETSIPFSAVLGLSAALRHRDAATAAHSHRVADLCMAVAKDLMTAGEAFVLEAAAILHDIGKIGVPDAILLKPGPLTEEEWEVMENHDRIGLEIINAAFHHPELTNIVRAHHAFFAGGARDPSLPTGANIPLRARILTIADAYDAMVSDRPYRKRRTPELAFEELRRWAGTQFDPKLVERFIDAVSALNAGESPDRLPEATHALLNLGLATERLGAAIDDRDLKGLAVIATRLRDEAALHGWPEISARASELLDATEGGDELGDVLESTQSLLELCQSTQAAFLEAASLDKDRAAKPDAA